MIWLFMFAPTQLIFKQKSEALVMLFAVPVVWYFGVIDALLFGNEVKDLPS